MSGYMLLDTPPSVKPTTRKYPRYFPYIPSGSEPRDGCLVVLRAGVRDIAQYSNFFLSAASGQYIAPEKLSNTFKALPEDLKGYCQNEHRGNGCGRQHISTLLVSAQRLIDAQVSPKQPL